jgi:glycosyltransferase involved in cell wall biosynthesis
VNVLMLTPMVPSASASSAGAIVMHQEVRALAACHDVTLATLATANDDAAIRDLRDTGLRVHAVMRHREHGPGALVRRALLGFRWRLGHLPLRTLVFHERAMQATLDRLATTRYDIVHVVDNAMAQYRRPRSSATVLSEYEVRLTTDDAVVGAEAMPSRRAREAERERWQRYQSRVWNAFDRVQVFTERDAATVRDVARCANRVVVNPFGVDLPELVSDREMVAGNLVFVGGFAHPPNEDAAIWLAEEILPLVRARCPDARLTIVGADPPETVRRLAGPTTVVTGHVDAVEPYLDSAEVVVAPVRSGGGMRLKVLQAMARSRPVVTTGRGAEGVWNPPGAPTLRVADDAAGIAAHIVELLESAEARSALGMRARAAVAAHHTWAQFAQRMHATYAALAASEAA